MKRGRISKYKDLSDEEFSEQAYLRRRCYSMKNSDRVRGTRGDLTPDEFVKWYKNEPEVCGYCGCTTELYFKRRSYIISYKGNDHAILRFKRIFKTRSGNSNRLTVDRTDSSWGYTLSNMTKCCWICNVIKGQFIHGDEFKKIAPDIMKELDRLMEWDTP